MRRDLLLLEKSGHIIKDRGMDLYKITELGKHDINIFITTINKFRINVNKALNPKYSPIGSLVVHIIIGALKLTGAFLTGSAGLLGDGIDSTIDAISAVVVSIAMRYKKEKQATYLLIILMLGSGIMIIYESILSLIRSEPLSNGVFGIIAASVSIVLCSFLFLYQRIVGYFKRNLAVLTQAADSKNHIIVGFLVFAGVILGYFNLRIIDSIVGILIGILILRSSYLLFQDIRAAARGEEVDYEKYKLGFMKKVESSQKNVLMFWAIWKIDSGFDNEEKLSVEFENTFDTKLDDFFHIEIHRDTEKAEPETIKISTAKKLTDLHQAIMHLLEGHYIQREKRYFVLTRKGKEYLHKKLKKLERKRH